MRRPSTTPPFRGPDGEVLPDSIAEVGYQRIGGVDQWVLIRGERLANPPLVILHGGPGFSDLVFFRGRNAELEKHFTVVYWDQRGAGKSFDPALSPASMTVEQFLADLDELVDAVCARLDKKKVALLGHSWGTALGVLYAARFPEKVFAYVGAAQVGDSPAVESLGYAHALAEAERLGKRRVLEKLREIGPPPFDTDRLFAERTAVQRLHGELGLGMLLGIGRMVLATPEASVLELPETMRAFRFSIDAMLPEVSRLNLVQAVPALTVPVFFIVGRRDHWVPPQTSVAYFDALRAPSKQLIWFEHSGHEAFADEPAKFNGVMIDLVRPLCAPPESATPRSHALPGDEVLPDANAEVTHHIDIDAPPEDVWPWLVQMGRTRGGWYSWDLLDNGGVKSADRIVPALQHLAVGDLLPIKRTGDAGFAVLAIDPPRALVLGDPALLPGRPPDDRRAPRATWAFCLEPLGHGGTRLRARVRVRYAPTLGARVLAPVIGVLHDVMERKQLTTLKRRAEARAGA